MGIKMNSTIEEIQEYDTYTNNKDRKYLKTVINQLSETEHIEIFKIIKNETDKFTENNNGIFINLSNLSDKIILKIVDFVNYCIKNKKMLDNEKKERDSIIEIVNSKDIENSDPESVDDDDEYELLEDTKECNHSETINNVEKDIVNSSLNFDKYVNIEK